MRRPGDSDRLQRLIAADAVIGMDDEIARRQVVHLGDELVEVAAAPRGPRQPVAEDVLLAEQHDFPGREPLLDGQYRKTDSSGRESSQSMTVGHSAQGG